VLSLDEVERTADLRVDDDDNDDDEEEKHHAMAHRCDDNNR